MLPAGFPAHHSYCPYTTGPNNGAWQGPDLAKAARLAKESGTTGVPVTVWSFDDSPDKTVGAYLVRLLRELGYRAKLHAVPYLQYVAAVGNAHRKIQMGEIVGWLADFPSPSTFFLPLLTCPADLANTANFAFFCDPQVDKLASQAQAAQLTDPAYARRLWARDDRLVTDQAPYVPEYNVSTTVFVSARVRNYQASPLYGPLLDQIWIR